jgi:hypothetical protein
VIRRTTTSPISSNEWKIWSHHIKLIQNIVLHLDLGSYNSLSSSSHTISISIESRFHFQKQQSQHELTILGRILWKLYPKFADTQQDQRRTKIKNLNQIEDDHEIHTILKIYQSLKMSEGLAGYVLKVYLILNIRFWRTYQVLNINFWRTIEGYTLLNIHCFESPSNSKWVNSPIWVWTTMLKPP